MKYSSLITSTPQNRPAFGHTQIANNAGGFYFEISKQKQLERFLILGTEGGTYHVGELELTQQNAKNIIELIKADGVAVVATLNKLRDRVPKQDTIAFVLALVATHGDEKAKKAAYNAISTLFKTPTQLFTFISNINDLRGWSRGLRGGVSKFYTEKTLDQLSYALVKYRQRNGYTHRDVMRLAHPVAKNDVQNKLFKYAVGKLTAAEVGSPLITAFEAAQNVKSSKELVALLKANANLTWEMIPTEYLKDASVLEQLAITMPYVATLRNLNRFTIAGLVDSNVTSTTKVLVERLLNEEAIIKSGVHPIQILNALATYSSGRSNKGSGTWTPNQRIVDSLNKAFELSFQNVKPTGKNILLAIDKSGSMTRGALPSGLTPAQVAAAMAAITLKVEPNVDLIFFDTNVYKLPVGASTSFQDLLKIIGNGGGTDLSLPFGYALQTKGLYDVIVTYTDNETWAGRSHAVEQYNNVLRYAPDTKAVVVASSANNGDVLPASKNTLGIAGFDAAVPNLISDFIRGDI